jgi:type VI secretion system protein ImpL
MKRRTKIWIIALAVMLLYIVVAIVAGRLLGLTGRDLWVLRIVLTTLGIISAALIVWFFRDRTPAAPATPEARLAAEVEQVFAAARTRLAASSAGLKDARFSKLPVVVVFGPAGSTKTTAIVRSGLEPELLAGEAMRGESVAPTKTTNVWFAQGTIFAEAGSPVLAAPENWKRFVRALRPRSLVAALTGKPQAPRLAVVCFGCDEFLKPGSSESIPAAARTLRERLGEAATELGVQLPTYVLFTKADAVPHFEAFVRNFSADEARAPLGAALATDDAANGTYTERVTPRLERAMQELYRSLAARRVAVLSREHAAEWKPTAYEFPREFRKISPLVVDFLRELGKPSALKGNPVLRGFYFAGVQPVYVSDSTPEYTPALQPARAEAVAARSATGVFSQDAMAAAGRVASPAAVAPRTRKIPRWDFLPRLFREVILGDDAAIRLTQGGERVGFLRRASIASLGTVALLLSMAFGISYSGNRQLQRQTADAARGILAIAPSVVDFPPADAMRRLDTLRAQLDTLSAYDHGHPPLSLRWGLYSGSALYPQVRSAYFSGFNRLMFGNTKTAMVAALRALPETPTPNDDYGASYGLLKAYLITTTHPEKSTVEFLSPVLLKQWLGTRTLDPERMQIAQRQFDTYARELQFYNPFPDKGDPAAVARGRAFLQQFEGSKRIYQFMLADVGKKSASIQFNRRFPGSAQYLVDSYEVPGAFTKAGYAFMQDAFKGVDRYLQGESWVVGEGAHPMDKGKLIAELRAEYAADYADQWRTFLRSAVVARYANVRDASQKLTALSGNQSPLLELFSVASRNTNVAPEIASIFQPVQSVTPPTDTTKLIGPGNQPYMTALVGFEASIEQAAAASGPAGEAAASQAAGSAGAALAAARQIASGFTFDPKGQVHTTVQKLMEDPVNYAQGLLTRYGADQINNRTRSLCAMVQPLLTKLPFNPSSTVPASVQEVSAFLKPGSGALWTVYNDVLQSALQKQGAQYVPTAGTVRLSPAFVDFFNRAAMMSDALFEGGSADPHYSMRIKPMMADGTNGVTITLEGTPVRATRNNTQNTEIDWPSPSHEARLEALLGNVPMTLVGAYNGPWALFQLFYDADMWQQLGDSARAEWTPRTARQGISLPGGGALKIMVNVFPAAKATILKKGYLGAMRCVSDPAR